MFWQPRYCRLAEKIRPADYPPPQEDTEGLYPSTQELIESATTHSICYDGCHLHERNLSCVDLAPWRCRQSYSRGVHRHPPFSGAFCCRQCQPIPKAGVAWDRGSGNRKPPVLLIGEWIIGQEKIRKKTKGTKFLLAYYKPIFDYEWSNTCWLN